MGRKRKEIKINFKCESCGYIPESDKEKSNENWNVISLICPKCKGKIKIDYENSTF